MDHIRVMQLFFLMEAGIATNQLIDDIFQRVSCDLEGGNLEPGLEGGAQDWAWRV